MPTKLTEKPKLKVKNIIFIILIHPTKHIFSKCTHFYGIFIHLYDIFFFIPYSYLILRKLKSGATNKLEGNLCAQDTLNIVLLG